MLPVIQILQNQKEGTPNGQYWAPCTPDQPVNLTDEETEAQEGKMTQLGFSPLLVSSPSSQQHLEAWNFLSVPLCFQNCSSTRQDQQQVSPSTWLLVLEEGVELVVAGWCGVLLRVPDAGRQQGTRWTHLPSQSPQFR